MHKNEMYGISSYGDLLNEVVEDEFELTTGNERLNKIMFHPSKLMKISDRPSIFRNFCREQGYCQGLDGIVLGPQNANPLKRQK